MRRLFNLIVNITGVLGFFFGIFTYIEGRQVSLISYNSQQTYVYRPDSLFKFKFTELQSQKDVFGETVYTSVIGIWNGGTTTIKDSDIRTPLTLKQIPGSTILSARLVDVYPAKGTDLTATFNKDNIVINWKNFDPDTGIRIALLHTFSNAVNLEGTFAPGVSLKPYTSQSTLQIVILLTLIISSIPIIVVVATYIMKSIPQVSIIKYVAINAVVLAALLSLIYTFANYNLPVIGTVKPPFNAITHGSTAQF